MSSGLDGKVAIVTGATSGIGAATALALAEAGAKVVISGRSNAGAEATATAIAAAGGEARIVLGDLTDSAISTELVTYAVDELGGVDVLANVAGVIVRGDATVTTDEDWRHTMAVNVDAVFYLSRAVIPAMRKRGGGAIVNLASNVGLVGAAGLPAYCASKGAVVQLTRAMAIDHAAEGIRVNALCPGAVDTPMLESGHRRERTRADILDANIAAIPEGRVATPEEVAQAILFLVSDQSRHITGVALPIDGGYVAR